MVAGDIYKWNVKLRDDKLKVIGRQIATPDNQSDIIKLLPHCFAVDQGNNLVT
jgi:hypothetical protein